MITDRDVTRAVRDWLEEGVTVLPDHALDEVLEQVPSTPQRRRGPAWRTDLVNSTLKLGLAAAAVIVVAVVGGGFLLRPGPNLGGPSTSGDPTATPTVAPSATAEPSAAPTPTPAPSSTPIPAGELEGLSDSDLAAGRWNLSAEFPVAVAFTLGDGWVLVSPGTVRDGVAIAKEAPDAPNAVVFIVVTPTDMYADACNYRSGLLTPRLGPTVDDFVTAVTAQANTEIVRAPEPVTVDGYTGVTLTIRNAADGVTCGELTRWPTSAGDRTSPMGEVSRLWVLDVEGTRVVIDIGSQPTPDPDVLAEAEAIVESIDLGPR